MSKPLTPTLATIQRWPVAKLAAYAANDLRLLERECYRFEGGPLPKAVLLRNIEKALKRDC